MGERRIFYTVQAEKDMSSALILGFNFEKVFLKDLLYFTSVCICLSVCVCLSVCMYMAYKIAMEI